MNNNFDKVFVDLGNVKENSKHKISYKANSPLKIKKIETSCGCSSAVYKKWSKRIQVTYKAGKFPPQVEAPYAQQFKRIVVTYENDTTDLLTFSAKILKP